MSTDAVLLLAREGVQIAILLAAPALLTCLVVGMAISFLQAVTQMQDQTLSFVPKMAAVAVAMIVFGGWMLTVAVKFMHHAIVLLPRLAK